MIGPGRNASALYCSRTFNENTGKTCTGSFDAGFMAAARSALKSIEVYHRELPASLRGKRGLNMFFAQAFTSMVRPGNL